MENISYSQRALDKIKAESEVNVIPKLSNTEILLKQHVLIQKCMELTQLTKQLYSETSCKELYDALVLLNSATNSISFDIIKKD